MQQSSSLEWTGSVSGAMQQSSSLEWLSNVSQSQLAQITVAVETLSSELSSASTRLSGEQPRLNAAWERRLAAAKADWSRELEVMRAECREQLLEADHRLSLQADETRRLKEEVALRISQRELVSQRLAQVEAEQRAALARSRAAVRSAGQAEAEAAEATASADAMAAEHERARRRAEAERDVLVAALAISEGASEYLALAADPAKPAAHREAAMLSTKLESMNALVRRHAADAADASQLVADAELRRARAEHRCAALESRLRAVEGELVARARAAQEVARIGGPSGAAWAGGGRRDHVAGRWGGAPLRARGASPPDSGRGLGGRGPLARGRAGSWRQAPGLGSAKPGARDG